jgi:peptidyl-prolyl cis-trans isomerase A (cyclophilin A)
VVADSKAVVDAIGVVPTDGFDRPIEPVIVEKVEIKRVEG